MGKGSDWAVVLVAGAVTFAAGCADPVRPSPLEPAAARVNLDQVTAIIPNAQPSAINDKGAVVGKIGSQAFLWTASKGIRYLAPPGTTFSEALDINNAAYVVGGMQIGESFRGVLWLPDGSSLALGTLGGDVSYARGINDNNQVVGNTSNGAGDLRAFIWSEATGMVDLGDGFLGYPGCVADDVNNKGQVVGACIGPWEDMSTPQPLRAFVWSSAAGMVDIGTLGGPYARAYAINDDGHIVGSSVTAGGEEHAFLWTPESGMHDLGTFTGRSHAADINNDELVVGSAYCGSNPCPFAWTAEGGMVSLLVPEGYYAGYAAAVNESGKVVGHASCQPGESCVLGYGLALYWGQTSFRPRESRPDPDIGVDLGAIGYNHSAAYAVSDRGVIVGETEVGISGAGLHAFRWTTREGFTDLDPTGLYPGSMANDINKAGYVVGSKSELVGGNNIHHAVMWAPDGSLISLGTLDGKSSIATAINELNEVVGYAGGAHLAGSLPPRALLWTQSGGIVDLGTLPGYTYGCQASDINELTQIVGVCWDGGGYTRPFLWSSATGMVDLGTLGGVYGGANGINDMGMVVGSSTVTVGGLAHAFLWTPQGGMSDLGTLVEGDRSTAEAINNKGVIVGYSTNNFDTRTAFVWKAASGLAALEVPEGYIHGEANDVNAAGLIVGIARKSGLPRAFVWGLRH